jgi:hypothetical protein
MYPLLLEAFANLEVWPVGHDFLCVGSSSSLLLVKPLMAISGKSRLLCAGFRTEARRRHRVIEGGLHL